MKDKTVLIVDFDERSIEPLSNFMEEEGFGVLVARDGEEGLEMAKKENPDLVILEPMLPKLHGFELCGIITHDLEPKIPVIILTKFYREEQFKIESVRSFGASAFVSKPFKKPEMSELLEELVPKETRGEAKEEEEEKESEEAAIPDTPPTEATKELQEEEPSEKPEPDKGEVIEPEMMEKDALEVKPEEKPLEPKAKKDRDFGQELDAMLEDAFADLGLVGGEKNAPPLNGKSPDEDAKPDKTDAALKEPAAPAAAAEPAVPELSVEGLLSPEPEKKAPPQDDILQKIDEIAQGTVGKPRADVSQAVEEAQNSPETILQKADAVTESLEKELETKVKEMSSQESEQLKAKQKGNTRKNKKEKAAREKEEVKAASRKEPEAKPEPEPEAVEEKVEAAVEEKVEPAPAERTEPVSQEKAEAAAAPPADVPPAKPNLKEVVESEGMFSGYGQDDEKKSSPNRAAGLFAKIKRAPKKFIIPIAALALVIGLGAVIMIPKMSKDAPAEQATLGANTLAQPVSAAPQGEDTEKPSVDPGEDPNGLDRQAEAGNAEEDPPVSQPEQQPAERPAQKPEEKPEQKPERQSAPPPNPKPAVEDIAETQVTSQLTGETTPRQTDPVPTRPAQKPPQKNEEETGTEGGTGSGSEAAGPPAEKAASEPEQPVNRAPAKARVGDIVSIKQVDTEPELIQQELPRYPTAARGRGVSGTVLLNALISENGDVLQTVVIRKIDSPYGFNQAAERAVKQWKFRPAWKDGVRVKVWKVIPIVFKENMD